MSYIAILIILLWGGGGINYCGRLLTLAGLELCFNAIVTTRRQLCI